MPTQTPEAPTTEQTTAYHWIITTQTPDGLFSTVSNVFNAHPGMTRHEVYNEVWAYLKSQIGDRFNVLFWSLEPDQL